MKEFGSDFHYVDSKGDEIVLFNYFPEANLYATGRHTIQALILQEKWKRIWMPDYFCYEVIDSIKKTDIQVFFYDDNPLSDEYDEISRLQFEEGDVLFRMNYYGLRKFRNNDAITVPVIEDHSHDIVGDWALNSNADWCIASLRKTLPISEGGILWSPMKHILPELPNQTNSNILLSEKRWKAMKLKKKYLSNDISDKDEFRKLFLQTEADFDSLSIAPITEDCKSFLRKFDIKSWFQQKQLNWDILSGIQSDKVDFLKREKELCNNFSFTLLFKSTAVRDEVRQRLIKNNIYPVILWSIPKDKPKAKYISDRMLSIACDGRYSYDDMLILKSAIIKALEDV